MAATTGFVVAVIISENLLIWTNIATHSSIYKSRKESPARENLAGPG
jgi:hypothetical protein